MWKAFSLVPRKYSDLNPASHDQVAIAISWMYLPIVPNPKIFLPRATSTMHPNFTFMQGLALHAKHDTVCCTPGNNQLSAHGHATTWRNRIDTDFASGTHILDDTWYRCRFLSGSCCTPFNCISAEIVLVELKKSPWNNQRHIVKWRQDHAKNSCFRGLETPAKPRWLTKRSYNEQR